MFGVMKATEEALSVPWPRGRSRSGDIPELGRR